MAIKLQQVRRVRRWMMILLLVVMIIVVFSLNVHRSYRTDNHPRLGNVANVDADIPYCAGQDKQKFDLYTPINSLLNTHTTPYPLVIYIHGGGWHKGDKRNSLLDYYGSSLTAAGFAVASVNYRLAPKYHYPTQNNDVACAIDTIAKLASSYDIDTNNVILFGDSAGGLLASDYVLTHQDSPITVRGVISFYGTTDLVNQLQRTKRNPNAYKFLGTRNVDTARVASPLYQPITKTPPPFLFFHGTKDSIVSIEQAYKFYQRILAYQPSSRFIRVANAGHGFDDSGRSTKPTSDEIRRTLTLFALKHINSDQSETQAQTTPEKVQILLDND